MWYIKSRRAQTNEDYETWINGAIMTTLNAFDNAHETRATALFLFEATRVDDVRIHEECSCTVPTYWGTGGARVPYWNAPMIRRLTPKECERLQGFPDDWTIDQAESNRYKQLGNAVAVPVAEWIIQRMI